MRPIRPRLEDAPMVAHMAKIGLSLGSRSIGQADWVQCDKDAIKDVTSCAMKIIGIRQESGCL